MTNSASISDFRSDTVTRPTPEMYQAMTSAELGDDVFGDDPTVQLLEGEAAEIFGREAALYVPSGTMGNQICCRLHTRPGQEVILEQKSHIYNFEVAGLAALSGVQARPLVGLGGVIPREDILAAIRGKNVHLPKTSLICLENTHNMGGGAVVALDYLQSIRQLADEQGIKIHLDGARIFNAAVASQTDPVEYGKVAHTINFCLSKGLGAPVGSLIIGDRDQMDEARRVRKMLGGGMRQVGVLAAAGRVALSQWKRLEEDHQLAQTLARGLHEISGIQVDLEGVQTNIIMVDLTEPHSSQSYLDHLREHQVLGHQVGSNRVRFVTHRDVGLEDVERLLDATRQFATQPI